MTNFETRNYDNNSQINPDIILATTDNKADQLNAVIDGKLSKEAKIAIGVSTRLFERIYWIKNLRRNKQLYNTGIKDYWEAYKDIFSWTLIEA